MYMYAIMYVHFVNYKVLRNPMEITSLASASITDAPSVKKIAKYPLKG
jgi:hypothetical protein